MRLAIITTHPIQYYAPVFKLLQQHPQLDIKVFYTWGKSAVEKFDPGFNKVIKWDTPLLDGYDFEWVENTSTDPGSHHFRGIINPHLIGDIKAWQADALLVYGWSYNSHLKVIRHFKNKVPVYFRGDSTLLDDKKGFKSALRAVFLKWVYSHVDHAFYVGTNNKAYFKKHGLKDSQLTFAPHAIDNDRFGVNRADEAGALRQTLGVNANEVLLLFAGKFEEKKAPQLLLDAFLTLNMAKTHLLFVGDGILEASLKTKAGKNSNVHFMAFQNQLAMPAVYQACDLFCLPSKGPGETWGLAINEAMAAGKAILASDKCGCAADLIRPGFNGEIFESEKSGSIIAKLGLLIKEKAKLNLLGLNSKDMITSWSFGRQADAIINTLNLFNEK
jgi:glycosyltransferase involved in cell wall biosynthesis